jgi:DNA-binding NarL/FixJ family response regulator
MEKITVLIADNHQLIRESLVSILNADQRFKVVAEASSGEDVVRMAVALKPQIALIDIDLNGLNGFEIIQSITRKLLNTKVIGLSLRAIPVYAKKILKLGASGYVTKNSSKQEFLHAISEVQKGKNYICDEVKEIIMRRQIEPEKAGPDITALSKRELEVTQCIKEGMSSKEISGKLGLSLKTVEGHRYHILKKLSLPNSAALVNYVNKTGI